METYYLYKKTHRKTNVKYLGYTKLDPTTYKGSGKYWIFRDQVFTLHNTKVKNIC